MPRPIRRMSGRAVAVKDETVFPYDQTVLPYDNETYYGHFPQTIDDLKRVASSAAGTVAKVVLVPPVLVLGGAVYAGYRAKMAAARAWQQHKDEQKRSEDAETQQRMLLAMAVDDYIREIIHEGVDILFRMRKVLDAGCEEAAKRYQALKPQLCTKYNSTLSAWVLKLLPKAATTGLATLGADAKTKAECARLFREMREVEEALEVCSNPLPMPHVLGGSQDDVPEDLRKRAAALEPAPRESVLAQQLEAQSVEYMREYLKRRADVVEARNHSWELCRWARGRDTTPPKCAVASPKLTCPAQKHGVMLYDWATKQHGCYNCIPPCTLGSVCNGWGRTEGIERYVNLKKTCAKCV